MSDFLKKDIADYQKTDEVFLLYNQGIGAFTTQALDEIWKEIIIAIGGRTETTICFLFVNSLDPKSQKAAVFKLGNVKCHHAATVPQAAPGSPVTMQSPKTF